MIIESGVRNLAAEKKTSATGLDKNAAAALSYVLGPVTGIVFLILEKDEFVRFHAMQSTFVFGILIVVQGILAATVILAVLTPLVSLLGFALWLILIYKAWHGERWEVPVLNELVKKFLKKV